MLYKASASTNILITNKMGVTAPIAIGTRGTVGSLVRREIEYFRKLEVDRPGTCKKLESKKFVGVSKSTTASAPGSDSRPKMTGTLGSFLSINSWKRKIRSNSSNNSSNNNSGRFLPSMCSAVEVAVSESKRVGGIPGYSYKSLKSDIDTDLNSD